MIVVSPTGHARRRVRRTRAFTLLELIVAVLVIAVLASIAVVAYNGYTGRARAAELRSSAGQIAQAVTAQATQDDLSSAAEAKQRWADSGHDSARFLTSVHVDYTGSVTYQDGDDTIPAAVQVSSPVGPGAACILLVDPPTVLDGPCPASGSTDPGGTDPSGGVTSPDECMAPTDPVLSDLCAAVAATKQYLVGMPGYHGAYTADTLPAAPADETGGEILAVAGWAPATLTDGTGISVTAALDMIEYVVPAPNTAQGFCWGAIGPAWMSGDPSGLYWYDQALGTITRGDQNPAGDQGLFMPTGGTCQAAAGGGTIVQEAPVVSAWSTAVSPDGTLIATANDGDLSVSLFSLDSTTGTHQYIGSWPAGNATRYLTFSPDGHLLVAADVLNGGSLWVYAVDEQSQTLTPIGNPVTSQVTAPWGLTFSPDGTHLLVSGNGGLEIFSVSPGGALTAVQHPSWTLDEAAYNPAGTLVVAYEAAGKTTPDNIPVPGTLGMFRVDQATGNLTLLSSSPISLADATYAATPVFTPDGSMFALGDTDSWDGTGVISTYRVDEAAGTYTATGQKLSTGEGVGSVAFSPDGSLLAAEAGDDGPDGFTSHILLYSFDKATGAITQVGATTDGTPSAIEFSPDGKTLVTADSGPGDILTLLVSDILP